MPDTEPTREDDLRALLTDAIEVQLAALKAGISFWTEWIEHTSTFVNSATKTLTSINTDDPKSKDVVLELLDAGRASVRALTEIPRNTATHFIEELDKFAAAKANTRSASAKGASSKTTARKTTRRRRAGRAKA
jgi:hypothetical protein